MKKNKTELCRKKQHESIQLVQDTLCTLRLADRGSPRFGRATQQQSFEKGQVEDVYHWRFMDPNSDFWRSIYVYSEFFCLNFLSLVLFGLQVIFLVGWWWFVSYCHWTRIISSIALGSPMWVQPVMQWIAYQQCLQRPNICERIEQQSPENECSFFYLVV